MIRFSVRTVLAVIGLVIAAWALLTMISATRQVISWVLVSIFLAMALNPAVEWFMRHGVKKRGQALLPSNADHRRDRCLVDGSAGGKGRKLLEFDVGEKNFWLAQDLRLLFESSVRESLFESNTFDILRFLKMRFDLLSVKRF